MTIHEGGCFARVLSRFLGSFPGGHISRLISRPCGCYSFVSWCRVTPTYTKGIRLADHEVNKPAGSDKRKQSLYFPEAMLQEIKDEAARLDRSLSWVVQRAWKMARLEIKKIPSVNDISDDEEEVAT